MWLLEQFNATQPGEFFVKGDGVGAAFRNANCMYDRISNVCTIVR